MALRMKDGIIYEVTIDSKGAVKSMKKVGVGLDKVDKKAKKASVGIAGMAKQFGGFAVATAAVYKLAGAFSRLVDTADKIDDLNKATGVSHELLSKIAVAAKKGNANLGSYDDAVGLVGKAMRKLAQSSADARDGLATTQRAFADLGISTADLLNGDGSLKKIDEIVRIVGDGIKNTSNKTDALAAASRLLGRAGADLLPMFSELGGEFSHLAVVIDKETAVAASVLNDELDDLQHMFDANMANSNLMQGMAGFVGLVNQSAKAIDTLIGDIAGWQPPGWLKAAVKYSGAGLLYSAAASASRTATERDLAAQEENQARIIADIRKTTDDGRLKSLQHELRYVEQIIGARKAEMRGQNEFEKKLAADRKRAALDELRMIKAAAEASDAAAATGRATGGRVPSTTVDEMRSVFIAQEQAWQEHLDRQAQSYSAYDAYLKSLDMLRHAEVMRQKTEEAKKQQEEVNKFAKSINDTMNQIGELIAGTLANGIAEGLVEGTYDWEQAMKNVLKQILAIIIKLMIVKAINAAMGGGIGGSAVNISLVNLAGFHEGGPVGDLPRHHNGTLSRDEHPAVLQRGEYVLRRDAVSAIGASNVAEMNRTGQAAGGGTTITLHYNGSGSRQDAEKMADMTWDAFNRRIRRGEQLG